MPYNYLIDKSIRPTSINIVNYKIKNKTIIIYCKRNFTVLKIVS